MKKTEIILGTIALVALVLNLLLVPGNGCADNIIAIIIVFAVYVLELCIVQWNKTSRNFSK
jgi:hypothetical protein